MKQLSDSKNIEIGVLLSYIALGVSIVGSLFVTNRVLNYIGDYNYGLYSFVNSITSWLTIVSSALTASFLRFTTVEAQNNNGDVSKTNTIYLKLLIILGVCIVPLGLGVLSVLYFSHTSIGAYSWGDSKLMFCLFALSIINIGLTMPPMIFSIYINYKKKFVFGKIVSIITSVINFSGHLFIAYFTRSIVFIAAFTIVVTVATTIVNSFFCYNGLHIRFIKTTLRDNSILVKSIIAFSGILLLNSIVDEINTNVDKTLLGFFSIPEDVTKYQIAQELGLYLTAMSVAVSGVFAPSMHENVVKKDHDSLSNMFLKISKMQSIILCCVAFGFLSCGKEFILWWLGEKRIASYYIGVVLMIVGLGPLTMNASIEIQRAMDMHRFRALIYFVFAVLNIFLSIIFLIIFDRRYAIYSCLAGTIISRIGSHWIAMNIYNSKKINLPIRKYLATLFLYMTIGTLCFCFIRIFDYLFIANIPRHLLRFITQGGIFVILYLTICFFLNKTTFMKLFIRVFRREKC